jgi:hypothetical protein
MSVPTEAVLFKTARQRNNAFDELAKAEVLIEQLVEENTKLAAELEQMRADAVS